MYNLVAQSKSMRKDQFKREVEKQLIGRKREPWEILYFKGTRARFARTAGILFEPVVAQADLHTVELWISYSQIAV